MSIFAHKKRQIYVWVCVCVCVGGGGGGGGCDVSVTRHGKIRYYC